MKKVLEKLFVQVINRSALGRAGAELDPESG